MIRIDIATKTYNGTAVQAVTAILTRTVTLTVTSVAMTIAVIAARSCYLGQ